MLGEGKEEDFTVRAEFFKASKGFFSLKILIFLGVEDKGGGCDFFCFLGEIYL